MRGMSVAEFGPDQLMALFPDHRWGVAAPGWCTSQCAGEGRWIKESGLFSPARELRVRLEHEWPADVTDGDRAALTMALLAGVMDGLVSNERPTWLCAVTSTRVTYLRAGTTPEAVRLAARLATDDALRKPGWRLPSSEPA